MTPAIFWAVHGLAAQLAKDIVGKQRYILGVDGFAGVGKTRLAKKLAVIFGAVHLDLDEYSN